MRAMSPSAVFIVVTLQTAMIWSMKMIHFRRINIPGTRLQAAASVTVTIRCASTPAGISALSVCILPRRWAAVITAAIQAPPCRNTAACVDVTSVTVILRHGICMMIEPFIRLTGPVQISHAKYCTDRESSLILYLYPGIMILLPESRITLRRHARLNGAFFLRIPKYSSQRRAITNISHAKY